MELQQFFYENMLLEVFDHEKQLYGKSIVQEVNSDHIAIGVPMVKTGLLPLQEGETYTFRAVRDDALYEFQSRVLGTKVSGEVMLYLLSPPEKLKRKQRRRFFRLPCSLEIHYKVISSGDAGATEEGEPSQKAMAADLSGGGLLLVTNRELPPGAVLLLRLFLESKKEKKEIQLKGRVVRFSPFKIGRAVRHRYGIEFIELSERTRDEIIRFLFTTMRERLR